MKALIIDDNRGVRDVLRSFLVQSLKIEADTASDGNDGFIKAYSCDYDIIIAEIDLPVFNGFELYRKITSLKPYMSHCFVFITSDVFSEEYKKIVTDIPCPVLAKPFSLMELKKFILFPGCSPYSSSAVGPAEYACQY